LDLSVIGQKPTARANPAPVTPSAVGAECAGAELVKKPPHIAKGQSLCRKLTENPIPTGIGVEGEGDFGSKKGIRPIISPAG